ncbi:AAA family ATPase [Variovorax sp. HJSM1_2]|uniref:AAA family ATPase n=1 Tax=Variovorax sp. HJSM1_2 TaxID=3366263 RepID=UPI003BE66D09
MTTTPISLPPLFPFCAIAGQPALSQALLLAAADPALGGVLIEGPRGTAKSTAARALAELLGDAPFVTLPLSASLEQLAGTLDLAAALGGHAVQFAPGLLARAHGGVLYVDEVNLLQDGLVDTLLDAAASGVNVVERDGISQAHAARFVLIGTMNAEEGELRPQLLDRFGLSVRLHNLSEPAQRQAVVRARLSFDADPVAFRARYAAAQAEQQARFNTARARLNDALVLPVSDAIHTLVSDLCIAALVDGLRADLVMLRAARALAALEDAEAVAATHVHRVAELVLAHRRHPEAAHNPATQSPSNNSTSNSNQSSPQDHRAEKGADRGEGAWGAMPAEPTGTERIKPLRPLLSTLTERATAKKA